MRCTIKPSKIEGEVFIPSSKPETLRALAFAAMGSGTSTIENILISPDIYSMLDGLISFGAKIKQEGSTVEIEGVGGAPKLPNKVIDVGNSGVALRFLMGFAALVEGEVQITGDESIKTRRVVKPLLDVYKEQGMEVYSFDDTDAGVISIKGKLKSGSMMIEGKESQLVSSLLLSTAFLKGPSEIFVLNAGEKPFVDLTLHWLEVMGAGVFREEYRVFEVDGNLSYEGFAMKITGDFSSALFPIAAALVTEGKMRVFGLDEESLQPDIKALDILREMGAFVEFDDDGVLNVEYRDKLCGIEVDINHCIDTLPILAVVACFATSKTIIKGAEITRYKESNRISSMLTQLLSMGAKIEERLDGLVIYPSKLIGACVYGEKDHRVALSLMVAAAGAFDKTIIDGIECLIKAYPTGIYDFIKIGMNLELSV
ncbi:MAG: 3-phosphoshikimate 1-carboxyvinyltransferase [Chlamydiia bacterium]|nr:3-phosphoshikimate 1-carboxyvinyltransferase [Chlamydiia bacterium]